MLHASKQTFSGDLVLILSEWPIYSKDGEPLFELDLTVELTASLVVIPADLGPAPFSHPVESELDFKIGRITISGDCIQQITTVFDETFPITQVLDLILHNLNHNADLEGQIINCLYQ
jgi:hypothetical protein